ncbi:probable starch synthase 4, chloroplastic/amyloplastic [Camellia sinensis]|uniref:probable starch synthase 4, chloroplastic/amyloplastic n=1 Tax=Camellia sinensis TaxID=4442 RepID=UPI001035EC48|nr:probable starch synthase 4, chloroplastic/amyloplastic [Camellia sinensis]
MYSEELSHMLYAATGMVLVPSIDEPCGLAQMIGMRYGAVLIVRKTGGLVDTAFDMDDELHVEMANGFSFEALARAFSRYREKPNEWNDVSGKIMEIDKSWNKTSGKYLGVHNFIRVKG